MFLSKPFLTGHVSSASHSCHLPMDGITGSVCGDVTDSCVKSQALLSSQDHTIK